MFFLTPRYIKEAKYYRHALKRLIHYKEDILSERDLLALRHLVEKLNEGIRKRRREMLAAVREEIDREVGEIAPPPPDAAWRENVEVFLVAIVIAAGVRAYFLQPFKIPTGSMQPTLYGVVGKSTGAPPPNILQRAFDFVWLGRTHFNLRAPRDEVVLGLRERTHLNFFTFTEVVCESGNTYKVFAPSTTLMQDFGLVEGRKIRRGEPLVQGYVDTGDQVFVDKLSYNFTRPARGDVFVFKTNGIRMIEEGLRRQGISSQHYIKRLVGIPGDDLRIAAPDLFIDGRLPDLWVFQRVMSCENGYRGYANSPAASYLTSPDDTFLVPAKGYFALGDNSYQSSDSRYWGAVPEQNIAGRGLFVYWPFSKRWGLIR